MLRGKLRSDDERAPWDVPSLAKRLRKAEEALKSWRVEEKIQKTIPCNKASPC